METLYWLVCTQTCYYIHFNVIGKNGRVCGWGRVPLDLFAGGWGIRAVFFTLTLCFGVLGLTGWDGVIRGRRVEPFFRYSWCHMVSCSSPRFYWTVGSILLNHPCVFCVNYSWRHDEVLGVVCVRDMHTTLGVIRLERLGEMSFRWHPRLFPIPKSEPVRWLFWPTNQVCFCCYDRGNLGILGWDRLIQVTFWRQNWCHQCIQLVNVPCNLFLLYVAVTVLKWKDRTGPSQATRLLIYKGADGIMCGLSHHRYCCMDWVLLVLKRLVFSSFFAHFYRAPKSWSLRNYGFKVLLMAHGKFQLLLVKYSYGFSLQKSVLWYIWARSCNFMGMWVCSYGFADLGSGVVSWMVHSLQAHVMVHIQLRSCWGCRGILVNLLKVTQKAASSIRLKGNTLGMYFMRRQMLKTGDVLLGWGCGCVTRLKPQDWDVNAQVCEHLLLYVVIVMILDLCRPACWATHTQASFTGIFIGLVVYHRRLGLGLSFCSLKAQLWLSRIGLGLASRPTNLHCYLVSMVAWAYFGKYSVGLSSCFLGSSTVSELKTHADLVLIRRTSKDWLYGRTFGIAWSYRPWCVSPRFNSHFCKDVNQRWLGYISSVEAVNARFFCTPKRGRLVSYFWSPKYVLGMIRGYAPLRL
ncbi:hypothetical protein Hanom_Chr00s078640g01792551 [Helianthus anomalus]